MLLRNCVIYPKLPNGIKDNQNLLRFLWHLPSYLAFGFGFIDLTSWGLKHCPSSQFKPGRPSAARVLIVFLRICLWHVYVQKMGFWTLLEGFLLFANALAILNEDRFLAPRGWTLAAMTGPRRNSLKGQVIGLIYACQFLRLPLILFNIVTIIVKLFSG
ncbi:hypothetical protein VNO77_07844 [Canavalia gladiata]|uniref:Uncharacterized protein n=1 Tax=Canavalia gladiata TaxID=3824 RepID=A0AAN9QW03_CANGL